MPAATLIYSFPQAYPAILEKFRQCYDRQPYTYYIGWFDLNIWYYGSRTSIQCGLIPENDLWINYFTSSDKVKEYQNLYGEPDYIVIHKTFNTIFEALNFEENQLKFFKENGYWDFFLNQNIAGAIDPAVISEANKKENCSQEKLDKISEAHKGKPKSKEHNRKNSEATKGTEHSQETKNKLSESLKGREVPWLLGENNPNYGKDFSGENNPMFGRKGKDNPNFGKKIEYNEIHRTNQARSHCKNCYIIIDPHEKEYKNFESLKEISNFFGMNYKNIRNGYVNRGIITKNRKNENHPMFNWIGFQIISKPK